MNPSLVGHPGPFDFRFGSDVSTSIAIVFADVMSGSSSGGTHSLFGGNIAICNLVNLFFLQSELSTEGRVPRLIDPAIFMIQRG